MKTRSLLTLFVLLSAGLVQASSRTSANYGITADSVDTGGTQVSSANYSNRGSVGGITGLATVASPAETVKSGYVAQLYEVTGLALASTFVANGATQQLDATQTLDDGTLLALIGGSQSWSVTAGQLPTGLTLNMSTGVIAGDPTGTGSYSFTVLVTDGLGDSAQQAFSGNVISNGKLTFVEWEGQPGFFTTGQVNTPAISGPSVTFERDGVPNLFKYLYDINPALPMSAADRAALPVIDVNETGDLTLTFREYALETGVAISVQTSFDLRTWTTLSQSQTLSPTTYTIQPVGAPEANGDQNMEVDVKPTGASRQFIRLILSMP